MMMRPGELGWAIALAGLPWSYFLLRVVEPFKTLDIWHANTWWMQGWVLVLAGVHAMNKPSSIRLPASLVWAALWPTLLILWMFTSQLNPGQPYPSGMLTGLGNLWIALAALGLMLAWTPTFLSTLATALFWSGVGLVVYGWLQVANLDQFFRFVDGSKQTDSLVGTLGNPTHFACQLALWLPFAWIQPRPHRWWVIPGILLLLLAKSSVALAVMGMVGWSLWYQRSRLWSSLTLGVAGVCGLFLSRMEGLSWLNPHGRWVTWAAWWDLIVERPILGYGLGFVKQMTQTLPPTHALYGWKHLHNEYLQWWVETGLIGLGLLAWALWTLWQRREEGERTPLRWAYGACFVACCLIAILNFPWHLWQLGMYGLVGLAGWLILTEPQESHVASHS